jgi:hypothetical protein
MGLIEKLTNEIYNEIMETGKNVSIILIHPKTFEDLVEEVIERDDSCMNIYSNFAEKPLFKGIVLYRTLDVEVNQFIVK